MFNKTNFSLSVFFKFTQKATVWHQTAEGQRPTVLVETRHVTVKMSPLECTQALAHPWVVALSQSEVWTPRRQLRNTHAATPPQKKDLVENIRAAHFPMYDDFLHFIHQLHGGAEAAGALRVRASAPNDVGSLTWILRAARTTGLTICRSEESLKHTCTGTTWVCLPAQMMKTYMWIKRWLKGSSKYCSFLMWSLKSSTIKQLFFDRFMKFHCTDMEFWPDRCWCSVCCNFCNPSQSRVHGSVAGTVTSPSVLCFVYIEVTTGTFLFLENQRWPLWLMLWLAMFWKWVTLEK